MVVEYFDLDPTRDADFGAPITDGVAEDPAHLALPDRAQGPIDPDSHRAASRAARRARRRALGDDIEVRIATNTLSIAQGIRGIRGLLPTGRPSRVLCGQ
jgi:hypothetical protein